MRRPSPPPSASDARSNVPDRTHHRAFTLIELLVVMGIVGLLMFAGVPAMTQYAAQARLKTTTRQVIGLLSLARHQAISAREARTVVFDPEGGSVVIEETLSTPEPKRMRIPPGVTVDVVSSSAGDEDPPWRVAFQSSGALAGRSVSVVIASPEHSQSITIASATGAIIAR